MDKEQFAFIVYEQAPMEFILELTEMEIEEVECLNDLELQQVIRNVVDKLTDEQIKEFEELHIL